MKTYRVISRYNSMSTRFYEFQRYCTHQYDKFGKLSSLFRCDLLNSKRECNEKNCPLYERK